MSTESRGPHPVPSVGAAYRGGGSSINVLNVSLWSDNRANGGGRRQRTRRSVGALWSAGRPCWRWRSVLAARTSLSAIVRLGSGRFDLSGRTRQSGRLGGRPRSRAGIAAARSSRAAVCATAATSAARSPWASVPGAGARSGKTGGARLVLWTGSGQTGRAGGNVRKHLHIEMDAVDMDAGARCLVVDADADLDERTGALSVDAATLRVSLRTNGSPVSGGGPYVTVGPVGPVETD